MISLITKSAPVIGLTATVAGMIGMYSDVASFPASPPLIATILASLVYMAVVIIGGFATTALVGRWFDEQHHSLLPAPDTAWFPLLDQ